MGRDDLEGYELFDLKKKEFADWSKDFGSIAEFVHILKYDTTVLKDRFVRQIKDLLKETGDSDISLKDVQLSLFSEDYVNKPI
ncbi:hypothetical protein [Lysinibacillus xylanilyticus]|uniref:hypothetical protein n=1 Tax=Lysinibacillus xylanilyticus TaxID=582475 RepID=UPI003D042967